MSRSCPVDGSLPNEAAGFGQLGTCVLPGNGLCDFDDSLAAARRQWACLQYRFLKSGQVTAWFLRRCGVGGGSLLHAPVSKIGSYVVQASHKQNTLPCMSRCADEDKRRASPQWLPALARALLPGVAMGLVRVAVSYPVDFVRTRQQAGNMTLTSALKGLTRPWHLYRGASLSFLAVGVERGVQLGVFEWARGGGGLGPGAAAAIASAATCMLSVGVQATLVRHIVHGTPVAAAGSAVLGPALRPTLTTLGPEVIRTWGSGTLFLGIYGYLKDTGYHPTAAAVVANWTCLLVMYPLETLRVRAHAEGVSPVAAARSLQAQGVRALYRGLPLAFARALPSTAAGFTVYDWAKQMLAD